MKRIATLLYFIGCSFAGHAETADFTYQSSNGLYCKPSFIQFTHTSSGSPIGFVWDFGNGTGSTSADPAVNYPVSGAYTVKLLVIYEQSTVEVVKTVIINPSITATINSDRNFICTAGPITFTAGSSGNIASYQWDFGDATPLVTTTTNTTVHNYTAFGSYYATVKAIDASGCFATAEKHVVLRKPIISGSVNPSSGCIPANAVFTANVLIPASSFVNAYTWNFGDGSPAVVTTTNTTSHIYNTTTNNLPTLSITTNEGCSNSFNFPVAAYGTPPVNHIAYPKKTVICGSETAVFVSKATNANSYYWDFGDATNTTVTDTLATHKFTTLGTKTITATPKFNGCAGTAISFTIDVVGVIAGYTYANTCTNPKQFAFSNTSQGNLSSISWNMGDASPLLNTVNVVHGFPAYGAFNTTLTVTDNITGCIDTFTRTIYTATPSLVNADASICKNSNTTFSIAGNYPNPDATYTWNVVGMQVGPADTATLTINANILGNFSNNYVIINNGPESCPDTVQLPAPLLVKGPALSFTFTDNVCLGSATTVTNTSQPFMPTDTVKVWYWNFGISANDSVYQPQPYSAFLYPGTWDIKLTAIDKNGCMNTLDKVVTVNPKPFVHTIPGIDTLCLGAKKDTLIAFHTDNILWSPAGLVSCPTCDTIAVSPITNTVFYVTATNGFNCTAKDSVFVKVLEPFTAIASPVNLYACKNETVQLNVSPPGKQVLWSPAAGLSNTNIYNPVASPTENTVYTAKLTDSVGCFSSTADVNVFIKSLPIVDAGPDKYYPYNTNFSFTPTYSGNITSYLWTPSELLDCNNCAVPTGIATYSQTYTLTVTSDSGCVAKDNVSILVECKYANLLLPAAFTPNNDGKNDYFYPITRGIKTITHFIIYNREGQLVFESKNFSPNINTAGWDGRFKRLPQPQGAYVYFLEAVCDAGETLHKKGSIMLIR